MDAVHRPIGSGGSNQLSMHFLPVTIPHTWFIFHLQRFYSELGTLSVPVSKGCMTTGLMQTMFVLPKSFRKHPGPNRANANNY